jgi:Tfp pilus assembly PilM family ATPase
MQDKILGLDIGDKTIKAVLLERKGRAGGCVSAIARLDIDACGGIEQALKKLAENNDFGNVPCCVSLPLSDILLREVKLPFHDDNKIRKTLIFELEPLIPFAAEDAVADYLAIHGEDFLVALSPKVTIRQWVEKLEAGLGEVTTMDIETAPLAAFVAKNANDNVCGLVLDLGANSTKAIFYEGGSIVSIRTLAFGGNQVSGALAQDLSLDKEAGEEIKIKGDYGTPGACVNDLLTKFCRDLKNTLEFLKLNGTLKNELSVISLTGGSSSFLPVQQKLQNYFSLPAELINFQDLQQIDIAANIKDQYRPEIMDTALAVARRYFTTVRSFNFRQGEFKTKAAGGRLRDQVRGASLIVGILLALFIINSCLDYIVQARQLDLLKKQISLYFKKDYPEAAAMIDPVSQLKTKLAETEKMYGFHNTGADLNVLDLLKDISGLITPAVDIVITNLSYENDIILLKGDAKNFDAVSAAKVELMKARNFKEVTIGTGSLTKPGGKIEFDMRITLK